MQMEIGSFENVYSGAHKAAAFVKNNHLAQRKQKTIIQVPFALLPPMSNGRFEKRKAISQLRIIRVAGIQAGGYN